METAIFILMGLTDPITSNPRLDRPVCELEGRQFISQPCVISTDLHREFASIFRTNSQWADLVHAQLRD